MKNNNYIKIVLDILLAVLFILLFNNRVFSGQEFHEITGVAIGLVLIVHLGLNWRWIQQVTINFFIKKMSLKIRIKYLVDLLLFLAITFVIFSGILISKTIFLGIRATDIAFFQSLHISIAYLTLMLVGIHIGLHWSWVMNVSKKILGITGKNKISGYIAKIVVVFIFVLGCYNIYSVDYFSKVAMISGTVNLNQGYGQGNRLNNIQFEDQEEKQLLQDSNDDYSYLRFSNGKGGGGNGINRRESSNINNSVLSVLFTYFSIIGVFAIITYYVEKLFDKKKTSY